MKEYKYKVKGAEYTVKINDVEGNMAKVEVNGIPFEVEMERPMHLTHKPVIRPVAHVHHGPVTPAAAPAVQPGSPGRHGTARPCSSARYGECCGGHCGTGCQERTDRSGARSHENGKQYQRRVRRYGDSRACKQGRLGA